jgi:hypothetical protein
VPKAAVYGDAPNPGAPGTWDRPIWWALHRAARVGRATGRNRWRLKPPFHYQGLLVTSGQPVLPYGRSTARNTHLTHIPHTVLFAWRDGVLVGRMMAWQCSARTAYFRQLDEPNSPLCQMCLFRLGEGRCSDGASNR